MIKSSIAIAAGIEALLTHGISPRGKHQWLAFRFTDGWMLTNDYHPDVPFLERLIGSTTRIFVLDDGDTYLRTGSLWPSKYVRECSKVTEGLGCWDEGGFFEIDLNGVSSQEASGESCLVRVTFGDHRELKMPVASAEAFEQVVSEATAHELTKPSEHGFRFDDGWLFRSVDQQALGTVPSPYWFIVLDSGEVRTEKGSRYGSHFVRKHSSVHDGLRLWHPDGYIDIRPDGTNHWVHTNRENPITVWAGPQHS